jgi:hypothetical protein
LYQASASTLRGAHIIGEKSPFVVLAANYIRVPVPAEASAGKIPVTNAAGTTTSAKAFTVQ